MENSFKAKISEINNLPLGNGVDTNLLDFMDMKSILPEQKKDLKLTEADQEYFSGSKRPVLSRKPPVIPDKFMIEDKPSIDNPLSKKIEEYFGLREKRKLRLEKKQKMLEMRQEKDSKRVTKMLEQNIIDDIGVNFLFKRGKGLKEGLIDIDRAYKIVDKIDSIFKETQHKVRKQKDESKF